MSRIDAEDVRVKSKDTDTWGSFCPACGDTAIWEDHRIDSCVERLHQLIKDLQQRVTDLEAKS